MIVPRRSFLAGVGSSSLLAGLATKFPVPTTAFGSAPILSANDVRFNDEIEPWVRVLEETPRDQVIGVMAQHVTAGKIGYRQLLAALFLAGIRNIQPRPSVGFKFHAVLVVNSAHLASMDAPAAQKWLPIFWAIDSFKSSQARDVEEGNWTMAAIDESRLPPRHQSLANFRSAMANWDEDQADLATTMFVRMHSSDEIFEQFAEYAVRDFRSIGHKAIYLSNCYRTLETIGWHHAEPVLRSLSYALLNHAGEPNPSTNDLAPDRAGRDNWRLAEQLREDWLAGAPDDAATNELLQCLRQDTAAEVSQLVFEQLQRGVATSSIYDALFVFASELTMRQPAIVPLHAVTSTNAMNYIFRRVRRSTTRGFVLLQNAAFLALFREEARRRGTLADRAVEQLEVSNAPTEADNLPQDVFVKLGPDPMSAARTAYNYLQHGHPIYPLIHQARELIFLKGNDSHDYKYSSAVLEDYFQIGPTWRDRYFASALFKMRHAGEATNGLIVKIQQAIG
ncbi:MAG: hypothetical protein JNL67_13430 [Planctomycetaceae bacterium]|nr:hypothetical protein [Planctomycetaceae bacterium]